MRLDQFAHTLRVAPAKLVDFVGSEGEKPEKIYSWRQHPSLHEWMQALYVRKGGKNEAFNLSPVVLDSADLERLEWVVVLDLLPASSDFGRSYGDEREGDLEFIEKARAAIAEGKTVLYVAFW